MGRVKRSGVGCGMLLKRGTGRGERGAGSGERGAGSGERGAGNGERGTEVLERVVSGNLHKNTKWPVRIKNPVRSMIEKRRNNT